MERRIFFISVALLFASLWIASVQAHQAVLTIRNSGTIAQPLPPNSTPTTTTPTTPVDWTGILETFSYVAVGLAVLHRKLKDRNWKKKYKDIIVTKPF
jgi:hypothetical protein